ncbi:MAG TPA: EamA family transporter [Gemmatimonadaceae bacterium]
MSARRRGIGSALLAAALFGVSAPFAKLILAGIQPQLMAGLLYAGSGVGLAIVWVVRHAGGSRGPSDALTRKDAPWLAGAILFGGVIAPVLLMIGLSRTPASAASLLLNLEGVLTALLAWFVFRENFDRRIALGMLAILAGGVILSWEGALSLGGLTGPLAVAGACLCWGVDNNLTQKVSASDPIQVAMFKGLAAGIVNTGIALAFGAATPTIAYMATAMLLGFLSYGVSLTLFVVALRTLGTARTGAYFSTAPFIGATASLFVFHERPSAALGAAAILMAVGVWLHVSERHSHAHSHESMDHAHAHVHDEHHQHAHAPDDPAVTDPRPHSHPHHHTPLEHSHPHYPDIHHRHSH